MFTQTRTNAHSITDFTDRWFVILCTQENLAIETCAPNSEKECMRRLKHQAPLQADWYDCLC